MNTLYALVLVFSPVTDSWIEERYADNLPFASCDEAQRAVWAMETPTIDAYCVTMEQAPLERLTTYRVE